MTKYLEPLNNAIEDDQVTSHYSYSGEGPFLEMLSDCEIWGARWEMDIKWSSKFTWSGTVERDKIGLGILL